MQDVLVLLQHLAENEETTIKLMIECLYDVGAVNFINRKVQNTSINQLAKRLAVMSKPVAKRYGYYWFKKNCPELIVNWLKRKVAFPSPQQAPAPKAEVEAQPNIIKAVEVAEAQTQADSHQSSVTSSPSTATAEDSKVSCSTVETTDTPETQTTSTSPSLESAGEVRDTTTSPSEVPEPAREQEPALASTPPPVSYPDAPRIENLPLATPLPTRVKATSLPTPMEQKTIQIRRLQTQNRALMGTLAGTILVGGVTIWQLHVTQQNALQLRQSTPSLIVPANQAVE